MLWVTKIIGFLQNFLIYWSLNIFKYFGHKYFCQLLLSLQWQVPFLVLISVGHNINRLMWHSPDLVFPENPHIPRYFQLWTDFFFCYFTVSFSHSECSCKYFPSQISHCITSPCFIMPAAFHLLAHQKQPFKVLSEFSPTQCLSPALCQEIKCTFI